MHLIRLIAIAIACSSGAVSQELPPVDRVPVTIDSSREATVAPRDRTEVGTTARETLMVRETAFCRNIDEREPSGKSSEFAADDGKIYFWSNITNTGDSTHVTHVWFRDGKERARVDLPVNNVRNRVWSSKNIAPGDTGTWRVEIREPGMGMIAQDSCRVGAR